MKMDNRLKALRQKSTLYCGDVCLKCYYENSCPMLVRYKPIVDVISINDDGILVVRCSCYIPKEKKSDNG